MRNYVKKKHLKNHVLYRQEMDVILILETVLDSFKAILNCQMRHSVEEVSG